MTVLTSADVNLAITGNTPYAILKQLAEMAYQNALIGDRSAFFRTLLLREKLHSTGFGGGIAVPHGKSSTVRRPFVLFARQTRGVDWRASDEEAVNGWICIGVPQSGEEDQVRMIGTLCRKLIHADFIHQLQQGDAGQILHLLNDTLQD